MGIIIDMRATNPTQNPLGNMKCQLTPEQRAEGLLKLKEITDDLAAKQVDVTKRQSRQAAAINELEVTGECKNESDEESRK